MDDYCIAAGDQFTPPQNDNMYNTEFTKEAIQITHHQPNRFIPGPPKPAERFAVKEYFDDNTLIAIIVFLVVLAFVLMYLIYGQMNMYRELRKVRKLLKNMMLNGKN